MDVLILLVFVSVCFVVLAVRFFVWTVRTSTYDHSERMALLPLDSDSRPDGPATTSPHSTSERDASV